uniref:MCC-bdg_PDZ domain-containing protein n=1 Tax=Macrostomum lignano TaxID=282301 RepID=A0A1I8FB78_9PLAT
RRAIGLARLREQALKILDRENRELAIAASKCCFCCSAASAADCQLSTESAKSDEAYSLAYLYSSSGAANQSDPTADELHSACQEQIRELRAELDSCRLRLLTAPPTPPALVSSHTQPPPFHQQQQQQSELQRLQRDLRNCRERCQSLEADAASRDRAQQERLATAE